LAFCFTLFWDFSAQGGILLCKPAKGKQDKTSNFMQQAFCLSLNYSYILNTNGISIGDKRHKA
jgi:hypothetical protein